VACCFIAQPDHELMAKAT